MFYQNCNNQQSRISGLQKCLGPLKSLIKIYQHYRLILVFVLLASTITSERPMRHFLVIPTFVAVWLAKVFKWGVTGFTLFILFFNGIHLPWWLSVASVITGEVLSIAVAAAEMEMKHYGYLNS
ncbi:hypothetical protein LCG56_28010 (plasmid) [Pseudomonas cannabina pv. alisalensis]|uniref:Uncharacterized protein n=1 Tax=Pseudomonas syringae pv. maculicola str. ES4326 TaxID=629265 RepID=A0A8T8CAF1_PSEYM|nr:MULTISPECIES: hypothetical protein [Pseudomonas syringae group]QHF00616.1 hypothetical protein PMA4326_029385 [Pseudomonas syringae pv. maculicola str. ES4326]UBZ00608.1 hypothetical protein LCG56_28010 [Pseudomonas cannabina pv. alisalensis]